MQHLEVSCAVRPVKWLMCMVVMITVDMKMKCGIKSSTHISKQLRWSRGERAGVWYPSSRVQTRPKPSDFSGEKKSSAPLSSDGK